ncbi:S-Ena type endospore appendage [Bacillus sp. OK048]|uniref:S-Ena type endospore appendage n=1 Tax=Bacillus sp. OK048 TaxID=1882761 RepID=UPI0008879F6A|nr:S-Ena type endospore appendage [Bacillus sp. OK048]SDN53375.1 hypothetical protein SAMN05443253_11392 [Bacillus sp. OK048]
MSCSSSNQNGGNCCPAPQVFTENLCGNLLGPLSAAVWSTVGVSDFAQGTFEIFNSAQSLAVMTGAVGNGVNTAIFTVPAGTTGSVSIRKPAIFTVSVATGDNGTYCINLYKRLLA